jgi:hypothetical protein
MDAISDAFTTIASKSDLVAHHAFDSGEDHGAYFNFTFGALKPLALWREIQARLYDAQDTGSHMKLASMAMCSEEDGWHDYLQLYHFDPAVRLDSTDPLSE